MINVNGRALSYDRLNSNIRILCTLVCGFFYLKYKLVLRDKICKEGFLFYREKPSPHTHMKFITQILFYNINLFICVFSW